MRLSSHVPLVSWLAALACSGSTADPGKVNLVTGLPDVIDFGHVEYDSQLPVQTVTLTNLGDQAVRILGVYVDGDLHYDMTLGNDPTGRDLDAGGAVAFTLAPNADTTTWSPGARTGQLVITAASLVDGVGCGGARPGGRASSFSWELNVTFECDLDGDGSHADACGGDDCDDSTVSVQPHASETCDGLDNDCNGLVDDDPQDGSVWYADDDGDGFGGDIVASQSCDPPAGSILEGGDCDDAQATVFPGAEEICEDGFDNDCDGHATGCGFVRSGGLGSAVTHLEGEAAADAAGATLAALGDVDGDGFADFAVGAPRSNRGATYGGAVYLFHGMPEAALPDRISLAEAEGILVADVTATAGSSLSGGEDLDGDGAPDLLVGGPLTQYGGIRTGAAWVVPGRVLGDVVLDDVSTTLVGEGVNSGTGPCAVLGDVDGDGLADAVVGSPGYGSGASQAQGAAWVVLSSSGRFGSGTFSLEDADIVVLGADGGDGFGTAVTRAGDVSGDGLADLLVSAPHDGSDGDGAVHLFYSFDRANVPIQFDADEADYSVTEDSDGSALGGSVTGLGDLDGDGNDDFVMGDPAYASGGDRTGAAFLVWGRSSLTGVEAANRVDVTLFGENAADGAGASFGALGPTGFLVGAPGTDAFGSNSGTLYVMSPEPTDGAALLSADARLYGESAFAAAGSASTGGGDVDGDGYQDLLVGAPGGDGSVADAGVAYLLLGSGP